MNRYLYTLIICAVISGIPFDSTAGSPVSNSTEHLFMSYDDVSFNMLTLTFAADNVLLREKAPVTRDVVRLGKGELSLSLLRLIFLGSVFVDSFDVRDLYISLLRDTNGVFHLINPAISSNEVAELTTGTVLPGGSGNAEENTEKPEEPKQVQQVRIPNLRMENIDVQLQDLLTGSKLFSFDDILFTMENVYLPITNNKEICRAVLHVGLNGDPLQYLRLSLAALARSTDTFLKAHVEAGNISLLTVRKFDELSTPAATNSSDYIQVKGNLLNLIGAADLFSDEWARVSTAVNTRTAAINTNMQLHTFLGIASTTDVTFTTLMNSPMVSNISLDAMLDITVSNQMFYPGEFRLEFFNNSLPRSNLLFRYAVTNTPSLLVPWPGKGTSP